MLSEVMLTLEMGCNKVYWILQCSHTRQSILPGLVYFPVEWVLCVGCVQGSGEFKNPFI